MAVDAADVLTCPVCAESLEQQHAKGVVYPFGGKEKKEETPQAIYFCLRCGVGFAFPMLTEEQLKVLYEQGGYWQKLSVEVLSFQKYPVQYLLAKARWDLIETSFKNDQRRKATVSVLDVGAGHGFLGMMAAQSGTIKLSDYTAVETDSWLADSIRLTWQKKYPAVKLTLKKNIDEVDGRYDVIVLSHILEHLPKPNALLSSVSLRLKDDGFAMIDVPCRDYLFKENVFPHVLFFDTASLKKLCEYNHFTVERIDGYGRAFSASPFKQENQKKPEAILEKILFKSRWILPLAMLEKFYSFYLGVDQQNSQGTWLRALIRKKRRH